MAGAADADGRGGCAGRAATFCYGGMREMKTVMREMGAGRLRERRDELMGERKRLGEELVHRLSQRRGFGKGIEEAYAKSPDKVMNLAFAVKNTEEHLSELTEAQIASTLGATPENVLRVLRLGYLNTCRQEAFWEMGMQTAFDVFFYLEPKYGKDLRGAKAGDVTFQSRAWRSATDEEELLPTDAPDGTRTKLEFAAAANEIPISPYTARVVADDMTVANDDGNGGVEGALPDGTTVSGKIDYKTGKAELNFSAAPKAGAKIAIACAVALERDTDLEATQSVELQLRAQQFTLREFPITASFSKKLELTLGTSFKVDAQDAYLRAMADELRKSLDMAAFKLASRQAHANCGASPTEFDMEGAIGEAETDRIQSIGRYIDKVGTRIYKRIFRGGVSVIFGGPTATGVLTGHNRWNATGAQSANGIYRLGSLGDIPVFRVPEEVCPDGDLVCVYKNRELPEDVFLAIGTLLPLHVTDKLEFPGRNTEFGVASYGDMQIMNKGYADVLRVKNA